MGDRMANGLGSEGLSWIPPQLWGTLAPVLFIAQVVCVIHALRSGRPYWWFWVIMMMPLIGVLAYVFLEVRPTWGRLDWQGVLWMLTSAGERIRVRQANVEDSGTVRNRLLLADELRAVGRYDDECQVIADGLRGPFRDDAALRMRLAEALLDAGRVSEAERIVHEIVPERSSDSQFNHALLRARVASETDRPEEAERLFGELIEKQRSEAPRFYRAQFLSRQGRSQEAADLLHDILRRFRRGTRVWRFQERRWFDAAKRLLKTLGRP